MPPQCWVVGADAAVLLPPVYRLQDTFAAYRASSGYGSEGKLLAALEKWGPNRFEVPIPRFTELLWDQLLAPFFCFQVGADAC